MTVSTSTPALFSPITVGKTQLDHRIVMAPLTRLRAIGHVPNQLMEEYYEQRAVRPGTLMITEATYISPRAAGWFRDAPGMWSDEQVEAWSKIFKSIHNKKSSVFVQLWALGRMADPEVIQGNGYDYVSASNIPLEEGAKAPRPLTREEIKQYIQDYVQAAKNAIAAGADGVELLASNGHLPDQFLHETTNTRTDEYGGSIENRARFTLEVLDALVEAVGADRVATRFSPWSTFGSMSYVGSPIPQWAYVATELEKRAQHGNRLAYIHIVEPRVSGTVDVENIAGSNAFFRHVWQGKLVKAGGMIPHAEEETEKDPNVLVALGRYFISTPDLVDRLETKLEVNPYDRDTFYASTKIGYTDYQPTSKLLRSFN